MTDERPDEHQEPKTLTPDAEPASASRRSPKRTGGRRGGRKASLESTLRVELETVAMLWATAEASRDEAIKEATGIERHPDKTCGEVLLSQAPKIANALHVLSQEDDRVYRWLSMTTAGGGWGGVVFATLPVAQAIMFAHVMPAAQRRAEARRAAEWPEPERDDDATYVGRHLRPAEPGPEPFTPPDRIIDEP